MWDEMIDRLSEYKSAVLTSCDQDGYPYSIRCQLRLDQTGQVFRIDLPAHIRLQPGSASLLCHSHDDNLWNQRSFNIRGTLRRDGNGWSFRPIRLIPGIENGFGAMFRFVRDCRRKTKEYLAARNLKRPSIPWDDITRIKEQALEK